MYIHRKTVDERICRTDGFLVWSKKPMVRAKLVTVMRWYVQDEVNQEESEQNEVDGMKKGVDSKGKVMHI